ncbi:MAG: hypothetical protein IT453_13285 [Planctomycetes bacterium]|nr:hypothetical protein [Planctomycetota bacterium]
MTNPHEGSAPHKPTIDEEEDLFSFDELSEPKVAVGDSATIAPAAAPTQVFTNLNEEAMSAVLGPAPGTTVAPPAAAPIVAGDASPATPAANAPAADKTAAAATTQAPAPAAQAAPRVKFDLKSSPLLVAALALFAIANLALIGLTWKSMSTLQQSLGTRTGGSVAIDEGGEPDAPNGHRNSPSTHAAAVEYPRIPAQLDVRPEGEETLEAAHEAIERGDFERARRLLYGLLAVADRWEPTRRDDLEARATFTIADSFRLQAEAQVASGAAKAPSEHDGAAVHAAETKTQDRGGHE